LVPGGTSIAVEKSGSKGALHEYGILHSVIAYFHDAVRYFGEVLTDEVPDKKSLLVVYTHLGAALDLLVARSDYLKLRGEARDNPGALQAAELVVEGVTSWPVTSQRIIDALAEHNQLAIKAALRAGASAAAGGHHYGGGFQPHAGDYNYNPRGAGGRAGRGGGRGTGRGGRGGRRPPPERGLGTYGLRSAGAAGSSDAAGGEA
jgi:hypothetical protein